MLKGFSNNYKDGALELINQCLKYSQTNKLSKVLQTVVLQNLKRAEYSTKEKGHFGLQLERYSHFTSPIRRYPDLMTHRLIKNVLNKTKIGKNCIIGANALVTENKVIPERSLVLGSPGKVVRQVTDEEIEHIKENARDYVENFKKYK